MEISTTQLKSDMDGAVALIKEIQTSMKNFATTEKVDALATAVTDFQKAKSQMALAERKHKLYGTQANYDALANAIGKELVNSGKIQSKDLGDWLTKANANINQTDSNQGGTFLPTEIDPVVSKLVEENGIARRRCRVRNNVKGTLSVKKRSTRTTVSGQTRPDSAGGSGGSTYTPVDLTTKQVAHITTLEEKLIFESPVDLVREAIDDLTEAAAEMEDDVLFTGTGSVADLSFTGLRTASGLGELSAVAGAWGVSELLNLQTKVHTSVIRRANARYYMHPYSFAVVQTDVDDNNRFIFDPSTNSFRVGGYEIEFAPRMESANENGAIPVIFGDMERAVLMGLGRSNEIRILNELYAADNQIGVKLTYDVGFVIVQASCLARIELSAS